MNISESEDKHMKKQAVIMILLCVLAVVFVLTGLFFGLSYEVILIPVLCVSIILLIFARRAEK